MKPRMPVIPRIHFDQAAVVVALDSDFLGLDSSTVLPVKEFMKGRMRGDGEGAVMNRLYAVESQYSVTGAAADHRFRAKSADIGEYANALLNAVQSAANPLKVVGQTPGSERAIEIIAKDLLANRGKSVVSRRPPAAGRRPCSSP